MVLAAVSATAVEAASLSGSGRELRLQGPIVPGDGKAFRAFLAGAQAGPGSVLRLYSPGGKVLEAIAIGRLVRHAGLATAVDARSAYCDSACTLIFVAGARRHYTHGETVFEGHSGRTGLGFHTAHRPGERRIGNTENARGTDNMRRFYAEMGVPRAMSLVDQAAFDTIFRPSGRTALELGIATDLAEP